MEASMKTSRIVQGSCLAWLIGLLVFFWGAILSANAAPAPVDDAIVLTQKCKAVGGIHTVYLGKSYLRIESPGFIIFARAPKWNVSILNPKKKIYILNDYKECLKHIGQLREPFSVISECSAFRWRKAQGEDIAGLSAEQWCNDSSSKNYAKSSVKCWTLPTPQFPPQCTEILAACYGVPAIGHGIPLRFVYKGTANSLIITPARHYDNDGLRQQEFSWLDTVAVKQMQAPMALFTIPSGFKPTKDYAEIAVDSFTKNKNTDFILKDLSDHPEALFQSR
jgi:hypothetical protein